MTDEEAVRRGYDALAETYAARSSTDERGMAILEAFLNSLPVLAGSTRVLDAGCGHGTPVLRR